MATENPASPTVSPALPKQLKLRNYSKAKEIQVCAEDRLLGMTNRCTMRFLGRSGFGERVEGRRVIRTAARLGGVRQCYRQGKHTSTENERDSAMISLPAFSKGAKQPFVHLLWEPPPVASRLAALGTIPPLL